MNGADAAHRSGEPKLARELLLRGVWHARLVTLAQSSTLALVLALGSQEDRYRSTTLPTPTPWYT